MPVKLGSSYSEGLMGGWPCSATQSESLQSKFSRVLGHSHHILFTNWSSTVSKRVSSDQMTGVGIYSYIRFLNFLYSQWKWYIIADQESSHPHVGFENMWEDRDGQTDNNFRIGQLWVPLWSVATTQVMGSILWSSLTQSSFSFCPCSQGFSQKDSSLRSWFITHSDRCLKSSVWNILSAPH